MSWILRSVPGSGQASGYVGDSPRAILCDLYGIPSVGRHTLSVLQLHDAPKQAEQEPGIQIARFNN